MKILVVQTGFLGDVILTTPVIANLRALYPNAEIAFLTTPQAAELIQYHPDLSEILVFDKRGTHQGIRGLLAMSETLRGRHFDIAFSNHKSMRTAVLLVLARIPLRYGFSEAAGTFLYSKTTKRKDLPHEVLRNLAILRNIGQVPEHCLTTLCVRAPENVEEDARRLLSSFGNGPFIGIAPGSAWATKRWTIEGFSEVANTLAEDGYRIVLLGGPNDIGVAEQVQTRLTSSCLNLVGKVSILTSSAIIARLAVLISNDSAPLHLASAVKTPVVGLYCATIPEFGYTPWETPAEIIGVNDLHCRPCGRHGGKRCPTGTESCMRQLQAAWVIQAAKKLAGARKDLTC